MSMTARNYLTANSLADLYSSQRITPDICYSHHTSTYCKRVHTGMLQ